MEESDLLKYIEGRFFCIENKMSKIESLLEPITTVLELHVKLHAKTEGNFCDLDHRCESIESAMEKMLDILRAHDDLLPLPV
jgi:hypothetical protein